MSAPLPPPAMPGLFPGEHGSYRLPLFYWTRRAGPWPSGFLIASFHTASVLRIKNSFLPFGDSIPFQRKGFSYLYTVHFCIRHRFRFWPFNAFQFGPSQKTWAPRAIRLFGLLLRGSIVSNHGLARQVTIAAVAKFAFSHFSDFEFAAQL